MIAVDEDAAALICDVVTDLMGAGRVGDVDDPETVGDVGHEREVAGDVHIGRVVRSDEGDLREGTAALARLHGARFDATVRVNPTTACVEVAVAVTVSTTTIDVTVAVTVSTTTIDVTVAVTIAAAVDSPVEVAVAVAIAASIAVTVAVTISIAVTVTITIAISVGAPVSRVDTNARAERPIIEAYLRSGSPIGARTRLAPSRNARRPPVIVVSELRRARRHADRAHNDDENNPTRVLRKSGKVKAVHRSAPPTS